MDALKKVARRGAASKRRALEISVKPSQADKTSRVSKKARRASGSARDSRGEDQDSEQEESDDDEGIIRRRQKFTDYKLYKTYVAGKVLPAEVRSWFLISILARERRDGVDTQGRSPNRRMNLLTLISLVKNQVTLNDAVFKEFKTAVMECF